MYWYEDEVKRLENDRLQLGYKPETLFFGSSSIRSRNCLTGITMKRSISMCLLRLLLIYKMGQWKMYFLDLHKCLVLKQLVTKK